MWLKQHSSGQLNPAQKSKVIKQALSKTKYTKEAKGAYEDLQAYERIQKEGISPEEAGINPKTWARLNSRFRKRILAVLKKKMRLTTKVIKAFMKRRQYLQEPEKSHLAEVQHSLMTQSPPPHYDFSWSG